jgi:predicted dehydrogenase
MPLRIAFVGFRHGHILSLYKLLKNRKDAVIVAACEEDATTREEMNEKGVAITHDSYETMLADTPCDVVACGDVFAWRGARLLRALETGHHVIGDKPLCTKLDELDRIEALATAGNLRVGCMLDLPDSGPYLTLRRLVRERAIGEVHTVSFTGQHPLLYGTRPSWYFEDGLHGGTLNDIAIHAIDCVPWMTGRRIVEVTAARVWNARLKQHPAFQDGALLMLRLDNDGGVMGDVSYLSPDGQGYSMPDYWRFGLHGTDGYLETANGAKCVKLFHRDSTILREKPFDPPRPGGYFSDFLQDLEGSPNLEGLHTARVLQSNRQALLVQRAADTGQFPAPL